MAQIFRRSANTLARVSILSAVFGVIGAGSIGAMFIRSSYVTRVGEAQDQPVAFSHKHHVTELGIDCRYCHTSVEVSHFAGLPPTQTCMSCHSEIWLNSSMLEPVRASYRTDQSLAWTRIHDLPQFVYFNHSIHIAKGVGCATCHGPVHQMQLAYKSNSLYMEWCLNCHREPEKFVRPRSAIYDMDYQQPPDQLALGRKLVKEYHIQKLTDCTTCHR